jgi:hypothetical protein
MNRRKSRRSVGGVHRLSRTAATLVILLVVFLAAGVAAAKTSTLTVYISSTYYSSYNATLNVTASASFRDPDCTSSSTCDRNAEGMFTLRQGTSSYARITTRVQAETGQYSSALRAKLSVPCKTIPHGTSRLYLLSLEAVAPNAEEKTISHLVTIPSCQT